MMISINNFPIGLRKKFLWGYRLIRVEHSLLGFASRIKNEIKKLYKQTALKLAKDKKIKKY